MSAVRDAFNAVFADSAGEATDIAHRALRLMDTVQKKLGEFERQPATVADVLLGRCATKLTEIPVAELDATLAQLEKHVKKHGCSAVRCFSDDHRLSNILQQLRSTHEQLQPYLALLPK
jgi:hypothetical protein